VEVSFFPSLRLMHRPTRPNPQLVYRFDPQLYRLCYDPGNHRNGAILPIRGPPEYRQVSADSGHLQKPGGARSPTLKSQFVATLADARVDQGADIRTRP
jgi:hypothetical protein